MALAAALVAYPEDVPAAEDMGVASALGVAVNVQRYKTDMVIGGLSTESRVNQIGLELAQSLHPRFTAAIRAGYNELTQVDADTTAGMILTGGYAGVSVRVPILVGRAAALRVDGSVSYHEVADEKEDRRVEMNWYETTSALTMMFPLDPVRVEIGIQVQGIDGEELRRDTTVDTLDIRADRTTSLALGLGLRVDATGHIGAYAEYGARRTVGLVFARTFSDFP